MIYGLSHVELNVLNLNQSVDTYTRFLGFEVKHQKDHAAELQHGLFSVWLQENPVISPATLWLEVEEPFELSESLETQAWRVIEKQLQDQDRRLVKVIDLSGHIWVLWRALKETEYPELPALAKSKAWQPEAEVLLQNLLLEVPEYFRKGARFTAVSESEALAGSEVLVLDAVRGYIRSAPMPMRGNVKKPLAKYGFDWQDFRTDFEAE